MSDRFRMLTEEELRILRRNGIDPEGMAVIHRNESTIVLRKYKTGDDIMISEGDRPWAKYSDEKA